MTMNADENRGLDKQPAWRIQDIWNSKLRANNTAVKKRDYISPSDIGKPFLDRYYKMTGVAVTNPFDDRLLRIFDAGNIFEWIVEKVFKEAGILEEAQGWSEIPETKDHLKILGKFDHIVGGNPDWEAARVKIKGEGYPEWLEDRAIAFTQELEKKYPKGLRRVMAEIKSINSRAFWGHKKRDRDGYFTGYRHHKLQLLSYMMAESIEEGKLFYISKDDLTLEEIPIFMNPGLKEEWYADVIKMSSYIRDKTVPPREDYVIFNPEHKRYEKNWKVGRSSYLTKITGFKTEEEWAESVKEEVKDLNKKYKKEAK